MNGKECQELIAMNFNFDNFKNLNQNRSGFCHLFHLKEMEDFNLETVRDFIKFWEKECYE